MSDKNEQHDEDSVDAPKKDNTKLRRRVLKTALIGGASVATIKLMPEQWTRPIVKSVTLPAHAQISPVAPAAVGPWAGGGTPVLGPGPARQRGLGERLLDMIIPEARGGRRPVFCPDAFTICITRVSGESLLVDAGFDGTRFDDSPKTVPTKNEDSGEPDFSTSFERNGSPFTVTGMYNNTKNEWAGGVDGVCLGIRDVGDAGLFSFELIRTANAGGLPTVDLQIAWTAPKNDTCTLVNRPEPE